VLLAIQMPAVPCYNQPQKQTEAPFLLHLFKSKQVSGMNNRYLHRCNTHGILVWSLAHHSMQPDPH
jgi:hypothetical protein